MTHPSHSSWFYHPNNIWWGEKSSLLCSLFNTPITLSFLGPNFVLGTLFSNTLSLHLSLNVRDQVHTHTKQQANLKVLYTLIFTFLDSKLENKRFCTERQEVFPTLNLLLISSRIEFWFVMVVIKYFNSSTLSKNTLPIVMLWFWKFLCYFRIWRLQISEV